MKVTGTAVQNSEKESNRTESMVKESLTFKSLCACTYWMQGVVGEPCVWASPPEVHARRMDTLRLCVYANKTASTDAKQTKAVGFFQIIA